MATPVIMPRQGQSVETCIITTWFKQKGDKVKAGDILFSYETDKASFDCEASAGGILLDVYFSEGQEVPVLTNVAVIGESGEDTGSYRPGVQDSVDKTELPAGARDITTPVISGIEHENFSGRLRVSPRARLMAQKMGINLERISGSGPNGRIIARDIENFKPVEESTVSVAPANEFTDIKVSNVRKIIARAMHKSLSHSAQLTHHMSADARKILALRKQIKSNPGKANPDNITLNDMICFAVIRALKKHPDMNAHFLGETIRRYSAVHLGIAVDTQRGLMVPALRDAGELGLGELSRSLSDLAGQCRKGNVQPDILSPEAATFTVSNLGNYGVEMFTPIINLPQVAILGVNTIIHRPAELEPGVFGFVPMLGLSLTYDHRAVDGGPATLFLKEIKELIENFN